MQSRNVRGDAIPVPHREGVCVGLQPVVAEQCSDSVEKSGLAVIPRPPQDKHAPLGLAAAEGVPDSPLEEFYQGCVLVHYAPQKRQPAGALGVGVIRNGRDLTDQVRGVAAPRPAHLSRHQVL